MQAGAADAVETVDWESECLAARSRVAELEARLQHQQASGSPRTGPRLPVRAAFRALFRAPSALDPHSAHSAGPAAAGPGSTLEAGRRAATRRHTAGDAERRALGLTGSEGGEAPSATAMSRLGSTMAACLLMQETFLRGKGSIARQDSEGGEHSEISMADSGGAGVGATAAAAISVALAQSWAAAAGSPAAGAAAPPLAQQRAAAGLLRRGQPRFRLVAAVPRSHKQRSGGPRSGEARPEANGGSPPASASNLSAVPGSSGALESMDEEERALGDGDPPHAAWRASGSHLKLQWLSPPATVLLTYKPVPAVAESGVRAALWLLRRGVVVFLEPAVHAEMRAAVEAALREGHAGSAPDGSGAAAAAAGPRSPSPEFGLGCRGCVREGALPLAPSVDLARQLLTWEGCGCAAAGRPDPIPATLAERLDLAITLGGDGTVLWTCSLFAHAAVPPVVPFSMGSLGFMTPFPVSRMEAVLSAVTSTAHGFPLMLRHRIQCRIIRAGESRGDLSAMAAAMAADPCAATDMVVLNEVVIDRGMTGSLTHLQVYVDQNYVTAIQGDGLIIATPTGSTAYNLAAGGSMVHPCVPAILFTPICPHTLSSRPLVFPEHVTIRVKVPPDSRSEAYCSFDGKARQQLHPGDSLLILMSQWPVPMVCNLDASHDWFLSVRDGLNWNVRKAQAGRHG